MPKDLYWKCTSSASRARCVKNRAPCATSRPAGNPLMALVFTYGDAVFCWVKLGLTSLGV